MRTLGVTAVFVLLNAIGFIAYRAFSTVDVSASNLPASSPANEQNISRDGLADQPKADAVTPPRKIEQPAVAPVETPTEKAAPAPTSDQPTPMPAAAASPRPAMTVQRPRPVATVPPAVVRKVPTPPPAPQPKPTKAPEPDKLLEMEPNPYKRGE